MREQFLDTRRFENHQEWCAYLSARGMLKDQHRACLRGNGSCIAPKGHCAPREPSWRTPQRRDSVLGR